MEANVQGPTKLFAGSSRVKVLHISHPQSSRKQPNGSNRMSPFRFGKQARKCCTCAGGAGSRSAHKRVEKTFRAEEPVD